MKITRVNPSEPRPAGSGCLPDPPQSEPETDAQQTEQDRVVIAAAVAGMMGKPVTVRRIRPASGRAEGAWVRHGREEARSHRMPAPLGRAPRE